ncbi:hypothetical protein PWT90_04390 [Aphanocladium album]|nr:hypothetical protein PWT90_04390 [Aphanocladium album]
MNRSTPERSITHAWDLEAYSPESVGQVPDVASPVRQVKQTVSGAQVKRFKFTDTDLERYFQNRDPYPAAGPANPDPGNHERNSAAETDILTLLCHSSELAVEIGKHLSPGDIVSLYSISRAFHDAVNKYMLASIRVWIDHKAPEAGKVFDFRLYKRHLIADPAGRTWGYQYETATAPHDAAGQSSSSTGGGSSSAAAASRHTINAGKADEIRAIPGLRYLQLVVGRDRCCREIRAVLARNGHRTPATMHGTLLKLWLCLDVPTSARRAALLRNVDVWADVDLYNAQLLFVKLGMHFNDPVYGPNTYELLHLMMGQKGLYPLWQLLLRKRFTRLSEILALKVRYDFAVAPSPGGGGGGAHHWSVEYFGSSIHGVPYDECGRTHREGWGRGARHLQRPDELVPVEAVARGLELDEHLVGMMMWGYVDWATGENLVPSEDEMHLSDEEATLGRADTSYHWRPRHARKKRFDELSPAARRQILDEDEDERLRAMAWCGETDDYSSASETEDENNDDGGNGGGGGGVVVYSLDDEINRGYIVPPLPTGADAVVVPDVDDPDGWVDFVNDVLINAGLAPDVGSDAAERAEAWQSYQDVEMDSSWDWGLWLQQQQQMARGESGEGGESDEGDEHADDAEDELSDSEAETIVAESVAGETGPPTDYVFSGNDV